MNDKKYLPYKILHLILMVATMFITAVGLFQMLGKIGGGQDWPLLIRIISSIVRIIAMGVGILYMLSGYKKSSAGYYKLFFCLMVVVLILRTMVFVSTGKSVIMIIGSILTIILAFVLLVGKDLGRDVSLILLTALIVIEVLLKLPFSLNDVSIGQLGGELSMFMVFGTAGFMITAKYIDKELRGTK
ncbi:MAG: hypothetical protein IJH00_03130 [Erysipelotrichaceae bacterium]|nr:hypothetical protein [Erysipelotrichaceae bacterium]